MKCEVKYNKPLAIGATILDVCKWYMQTFYYKVLKPYYEDRMKFLYTDIHSIIGWFQTKDIKEDLKDPKLAPHFETPETEKVPGYMKIEKIGILMSMHYFRNIISTLPTGMVSSRVTRHSKIFLLMLGNSPVKKNLRKSWNRVFRRYKIVKSFPCKPSGPRKMRPL
jgi:hypothetical protein